MAAPRPASAVESVAHTTALAAASEARMTAAARVPAAGAEWVQGRSCHPALPHPAPTAARPARLLLPGAPLRGHALRLRRRCGASPRGAGLWRPLRPAFPPAVSLPQPAL